MAKFVDAVSTSDLQRLQEHLAEHPEPCPNCGYNLHHLETDRCPECGTALRLGLTRTKPPSLAAWLVMIVPMLIATGEGLFSWFWFLYMLIEGTLIDMAWWEWTLLVLITPVMLGALVGLIVRPWFVRWNPAIQWSIAVPVAVVTGFILMFNYTAYIFMW